MKKKRSTVAKIYYYERQAAACDIMGKKLRAKYYKYKCKKLQNKLYKERMM